jgi:hypothetical protein
MARSLSCTNCGAGLRDTPEENTAYGERPYPYDEGRGQCRDCGGTKEEPTDADIDAAPDDEAVNERMRRSCGRRRRSTRPGSPLSGTP